MRSGGEFRLDPYGLHDGTSGTNSNNSRIDESELQAQVKASNPSENLTADSIVDVDGVKMKYGDLIREFVGKTASRGGNVNPQEVAKAEKNLLRIKATNAAADLAILKRAKDSGDASVRLSDGTTVQKSQFESLLTAKRTELTKILNLMKNANSTLGLAATDGIESSWSEAAGMRHESSGGGGGTTGDARASSTGSSNTSRSYGNGGNGYGYGGGARAAGVPGGGSPFDPFGVSPPSSVAYAQALSMDSMIADGLGALSQKSAEGKKLMMLFLYFARMAESGDPGAMYQFMKFITYVITKDKANQNIQISTKLIQLQDLSRKATDTLMAAPTDDANANEFAKALQKARSDEATISTSQKLLADMLQEYAAVMQSLMESTKNMQDKWAQSLRTVSSRGA